MTLRQSNFKWDKILWKILRKNEFNRCNMTIVAKQNQACFSLGYKNLWDNVVINLKNPK